jgi:hypothetical protein
MTATDSRAPMSVRRYAKLAALGAIGVAAGVLALYALIAFGARHTATGGIDTTHAVLTWISAAVPAAAIIAAHLAYAKILLDESRVAE